MKLDERGWLSSATHRPSPNFNGRPFGVEIDLLVIHCISLPEGQFGLGYPEQLFLNALDPAGHPEFAPVAHLKVSSHFLIERQGRVVQFVSVYDRAWHAGESLFQGRKACNDFSIGIELEGCVSLPFEICQYEALAQLTQLIMQAFPAISLSHIVGHSEISPGRKQDPGPYFDWDLYRKNVVHCA